VLVRTPPPTTGRHQSCSCQVAFGSTSTNQADKSPCQSVRAKDVLRPSQFFPSFGVKNGMSVIVLTAASRNSCSRASSFSSTDRPSLQVGSTGVTKCKHAAFEVSGRSPLYSNRLESSIILIGCLSPPRAFERKHVNQNEGETKSLSGLLRLSSEAILGSSHPPEEGCSVTAAGPHHFHPPSWQSNRLSVKVTLGQFRRLTDHRRLFLLLPLRGI